MKSYSTILGHLACFAAYSIFGFNIIVCKDLTSGEFLSPLSIFTLRAVGAGALFWLISFFMPKEKVEKKDYLKIFAASVLGFLVCQLSFLEGIPHITPMDCSMLASLSPIYTMFIAAVAAKGRWCCNKFLGYNLPYCEQCFFWWSGSDRRIWHCNAYYQLA